MVSSSRTPRTPHTPEDVTPAATRNIWLAGLGAFAKAQADGSKAFEALVAEGLAMQHRSQALAQQHLTDVAQRFGEMTARAGDATSGRWDRLGGIFEDRVAQALLKLGTPTAVDWSQVLQRLEALEISTPTSPPPQRAEKQPAARRTKAAR